MSGLITVKPKTGNLPDGIYSVYGVMNDGARVFIYKCMAPTHDITQIEVHMDPKFPKFDSVIVYFWSENMYFRPIASTESDSFVEVDFQRPEEWEARVLANNKES